MMEKIVNIAGNTSQPATTQTGKTTSFWKNYIKSTISRSRQGKICSPFVQIFLIVTSILVYFLDPATRITNWGMNIAPGSIYFNYWTSPPVKILTKFYFFNVTNHKAFLDGREKLRVQETGPFVYEEKWLVNNATFNDNNTLTYNSVRVPIFQRELSIGDPKEMYIITPNVAFLGVAGLLVNKSSVTNFSFMSAARFLGATPFVNLTVYDFAWGYNDPLIKLANTFVSSWIPFEKLGILDRIYDEGTNWITIRLEDNGMSPTEPGYLPQYSIDQFNGIPGLKHWGYRDEDYANRESPLRPKPIEECKIIRGATESILFPRHMDTRIISQIFRKPFCRNIPIVFKRHESLYPGIRTDRYEVPEGVLDSPVTNEKNRCFCDPDVSACPVGGFHDISPCFYQVPLAVSWPHFREADAAEVDKIEGLQPNKTKHESYVVVQPDLGVITDVAERIQLNLWVKNIEAIPMLRPVANRQIPLFWAELVNSGMPTSTVLLMYLLLWFLPCLQIFIVILGCIATFVLVFVMLNRVKASKSANKNSKEKDIVLTQCQPLPQTGVN